MTSMRGDRGGRIGGVSRLVGMALRDATVCHAINLIVFACFDEVNCGMGEVFNGD